MIKSLFPIRLVQLLSSIYNIVTIVLWGKLKCLSIVHFNKLFEVPAYHLFVNKELVLSNIRDFK